MYSSSAKVTISHSHIRSFFSRLFFIAVETSFIELPRRESAGSKPYIGKYFIFLCNVGSTSVISGSFAVLHGTLLLK